MHEAGLKWHDGDSYLSVNLYDIYKSETCYFPAEGVFTGLVVVKIATNVKRLGFCGVYAQRTFHAIEPNQCYTQAIY